jgi:protein transport protein SEC24
MSAPAASPVGYGQPAAPGAAGYQQPDATYPGPAAGSPGVAGVTSSFNQMNIGPGQQQPQPPPSQRHMALNQLYPTDLFSQPFNVSELDLPPPPIVLPPNVRLMHRGLKP